MGSSTRKSENKIDKRLKATDDDAKMTDPRETDLVIPIMGPTGAGKSTLINRILGEDVVKVGNNLRSCTEKVQHIVLPERITKQLISEPNRRIVLLDTPGFGDTYTEDLEILRRIAVWLSDSYNKRTKVAGILYLHDITVVRFPGSVKQNLEMFRVLCGEDAIPKVFLVTTKWTEVVPLDAGEKREAELTKKFWNDLINLGAQTYRFQGTKDSGRKLIGTVVNREPEKIDHVLMQEEIVDLDKRLPNTDVGRTLRGALRDTAERLQVLHERLAQYNKADADPELRRQYDQNYQNLQKTLRQIKELKVPLTTRILDFFRL